MTSVICKQEAQLSRRNRTSILQDYCSETLAMWCGEIFKDRLFV